MTEKSDYMTVAVLSDGRKVDIGDFDIEAYKDAPKKDKPSFYCADCSQNHKHQVALVPVQGHFHDYVRQKIDMQTEMPVLRADGSIVEKRNSLWVPAHFKRAAGAARHQCEHPIAYAAFNATARYLNGAETDHLTHEYIFPILPPRHGMFDPAFESIPPSFRMKGMHIAGVRDARDFGKLLDHFERHAGLQHRQQFREMDGKSRSFMDVHFEDGHALFDYLDRYNATGRENALVCSYVMNPNTSVQARGYVTSHDGFIDRNVTMFPDGKKLAIYARGKYPQSMDALSDAVYTKGIYNKSLVHVFAPCWIDVSDQSAHHVEMEIYDPRQVTIWDRKGGFVPPFRASKGLSLPL